MKLVEKETFHEAQGHKPDSKLCVYKDNVPVSTGFHSGKNTVKGNQKRISCDLKDNKRDGPLLQYSMDDREVLGAAEHRHSKSMDVIETCKEYHANDFAVPFTKSFVGMESIKKDSDYHSDKTITECDLPECIVCYEESNNQAVKDICVDDGVPQDKIIFESGLQEKAVSSFLLLDRDPNEHIIKDEVEFSISVSNGLNSSEQKDSDIEFVHHLESKDTAVEDHEYDDIAHLALQEVSKNEVSLGDILSVTESPTENSNFTKKDGNADEQEIPQKESEVTNSESSALVPAAEEVDTESLQTELGFPSISCQDQNEQGESSFSGVHRLSSLVHYSEQITSGNVSLRSDSSTTSARSFAFPVLQPEWNCSPIRMAKADRRHFRKHKGWKQSFICCRF